MFRRSTAHFAVKKKISANAAAFAAMAGKGSTKLASDEKFGQAALEYLYERVIPTDSAKRNKDVENERRQSAAFDRQMASHDTNFERATHRLVARMNEAMDAMPDELRAEAEVLNSKQPPLNYRAPSLTPPLSGYEAGFGLDVAPLRAQQQENPAFKPKTDELKAEQPDTFPFVEPGSIRSLCRKLDDEMDRTHGNIRENAPMTGPEGETFEAAMALNRKAIARQRLILDLTVDSELQQRYDSDEEFRRELLDKRGIVPIESEEPMPGREDHLENQGPAVAVESNEGSTRSCVVTGATKIPVTRRVPNFHVAPERPQQDAKQHPLKG